VLPIDNSLRVLVVDDDPIVLSVLQATLESNNMLCSTAGDGVEALGSLARSTPDVIISDLSMPRMSGFELLPIVRQRYPYAGIIVVSGESLTAAQQLALPTHAYLQKDKYTSEQLITIIRTVASTLDLQVKFPPQRSTIDYSSDERA
jgi:CheY-like chemotaxis protein